MMPELLEVLRFERDDLRRSAPIRIRGRWYGDYPFRTDRSKRIPLATYRLKQELGLEAGIEELELDGERLRIAGYAYVERVGAPTPRYQHVSVVAVAPGRLRSVRSRLSVARARARGSERRDVTARSRSPIADPTFSGFEAALDLRRLRARRGRDGRFELFVVVRVGRIVRRRVRFELTGAHPARAVERLRGDGTLVRAVPGVNGDVAIELARAWVRIAGYRVEGETVVLSGRLHGLGGKPKLEAARGDEMPVRHALKVEGDAFTATIPLAALEPEFDGDGEPLPPWRLSIARGARPLPVTFAEEAAGGSTPHGEREVALVANRQGQATLALRAPRLVLDDAAWSEGDVLEVAAPAPQGPGPHELVLQDRARLDEYVVPLEDAGAGRVRARLTPGRVATLAGTLGLREGAWELHTRGGDGRLVPVVTAPELDGAFPCGRVIDHKPFELRRRADRRAVLRVDRDLDEDERGSFHEHRMRREIYRGRRGEPLREAVMYSSFHGRQYSDSPRAIHEELVRRGAPLEHLWVVRDGRCVVPDTATALREGSSEFYDALARSRYVVYNDHFPDWFRRREDQVCLQTWHGVPLKRLGFDASEQQRSIRKFEREWTDQLPNWQYVVSPNRFSTPHLRRAYSLDGELIETGYPRDDIFARDGLAERSRAVRERLGIPEGVRTVLYAPTYRDHVVDQRGRYRLDLRLDVDRLRDAVGPDTMILLRKHHYIVDALPVSDDGLVRDVSEFPDGTEIMLAADVLVTDYSSMMFDFANTGRPILFFTYDLSVYRDEVRGFYFDLVDRAPGPLLETTDEIAEALRDLPALEAANRDRYASFTAEFCELDDGHASARVVDRVFDL
jgi:CDP-glycerol glycerophosphotransferase